MNIPTGVKTLAMKDIIITGEVEEYSIGDYHIPMGVHIKPKKDKRFPKGDEDFTLGVTFTPNG